MATTENGNVLENGAKPGKTVQKRKGLLRWTVGLIVRLCIWYALLTPFFRCPTQLSELHASSPWVCKPYLVAREHVQPIVTPYYDTYAAPYVDQARPYVEVVHTRVYTPASNIAKSQYEKYGAPAVEQVQAYGAEQWRTQLLPRVQAAQDRATQVYKSEVDPYVQQGVVVASPYYQKAKAAATAVYWDHLVPFYTQSMPFIGKTYSTGQEILATQVMPGAQYTWSSLVYFANSSLWPQLTGLYSEQVEPQLVKIGQRLASYREGKRLRTVIEDIDSSSVDQPVSSTASTPEETVRTSSTTTTSISEAPSEQPTVSPTDKAQQEREQIDSDLQRWEEKFAAATDRGMEDLDERIEKIVTALIASSAKGHGESLSSALQTVSDEQLSTIKQRINELAQSLPDEDAPEAEESHREELVRDIRNSALSLRDRAHALREWYSSFDAELLRRISAAVNSTLDVLDNIRDLGLQEIGMRWAWMDGVTYADWARYNALKIQLEDWRAEIRKVEMNHKSIVDAKALAQEILDRGMEIAEDAAKELIRLKDVGHWKIAAREVSDNFDTRTEPPPPRPKPVDDAEFETSEDDATATMNDEIPEDILESPSEASSAEPMTASTSQDEDVAGGTKSPESTPAENDAEESQESFESDATSTAVEPDAPEAENDAFTLAGEDAEEDKRPHGKPAWGVAAAEVGSQTIPILDDVFDDEERRPLAHISSIASSRLSEGLSSASEQLARVLPTEPTTSSAGVPPFVLDAQRRYYEAVGLAHDHYTAFVSKASESVYGSPTPTPPPGNIQVIIEEAGSQYGHASSLASASLAAVVASASSAVSWANDDEERGIIAAAIADATSKYTAALSAASATLSLASASASSAAYGTPTGSMESLASRASENWENLVSKASEQIYGTTPPYLQQVVDARVAQFDAVQDIISELLVGKQPSFTESVMSKLNDVFETPYPATAMSSASSYASEAYGSASSAAAAYASNIPSMEQATEAAADAYSTASASVSSAIHGEESEEPQYIQAARDMIEDIKSKYSAALTGGQPGAVEELVAAIQSAQARFADLAVSASSAASEAVDTAASRVEDATNSVKSAAPTAKDEL